MPPFRRSNSFIHKPNAVNLSIFEVETVRQRVSQAANAAKACSPMRKRGVMRVNKY